jgi:hypothetical protein
MRIPWLTLALLLFLAGEAVAFDAPVRAPNLAPTRLLFLQPPAEGPETLRRGALRVGLDAAYATVYVSEGSGSSTALLDMESARAGLRVAYGLGATSEVGVEGSVLWMGGGVFDNALISYHEAVGAPGGGREDAPRNRFAYEVKNGSHTYSPNPHGKPGVGDTVLHWKQGLWAGPGGRAAVSIRGLLKLPTGSPEDGFGSGSADGGLGFLFGARSGIFGFFGNLDGLYIGGTPSSALDLRSHFALTGLAAATARAWNLGRVALQLHYQSTPYRTGVEALDKDVWMLAAGLRRSFCSGTGSWWFGFTEDIAVQASPDFAVFAGAEWAIGPKP